MNDMSEKPGIPALRGKVWLTIPCYGWQINWLTKKCILHDFPALISLGYNIRFFDEIGHADIYLARAQIVARFLEDKEATDLIMIDADVAWEAFGLCRLLAHECDLVAAAYPKRSYPIRFACRTEQQDKFTGDIESGVFEVWGMPAGLMRIRRPVLEKMWEHYQPTLGCADGSEGSTAEVVRMFDPYWYTGPKGERRCLAEDYAFCQRWRDIGGKVHMDGRIEMGHIGMHTFKGRFIDSLVPNEKDAAA